MAIESRVLILWGSAGMLAGTFALGSTVVFRSEGPRRPVGGFEPLRDAPAPAPRAAPGSAMLVVPLSRETLSSAAAARLAAPAIEVPPPAQAWPAAEPEGPIAPPLDPQIPPVPQYRRGPSASAAVPAAGGGGSGAFYGERTAYRAAPRSAQRTGHAAATPEAGERETAPAAAETARAERPETRGSPEPRGRAAAPEAPSRSSLDFVTSAEAVYRHGAPTLSAESPGPPARAGSGGSLWTSGNRSGGGGTGPGASRTPGKARRSAKESPKPEEKPAETAAPAPPEPPKAANPYVEKLPGRMLSVGEEINSTGGYRFDGVNDCYGYVRRVWDALLKENGQGVLPVADYPSQNWSPIASWDALKPGDVLATHSGHKWGADWHTGFYAGTDEKGVRIIVDNSGSAGKVSRRPAPPGLFKFYYRRTHELLAR